MSLIIHPEEAGGGRSGKNCGACPVLRHYKHAAWCLPGNLRCQRCGEKVFLGGVHQPGRCSVIPGISHNAVLCRPRTGSQCGNRGSGKSAGQVTAIRKIGTARQQPPETARPKLRPPGIQCVRSQLRGQHQHGKRGPGRECTSRGGDAGQDTCPELPTANIHQKTVYQTSAR